MRLDGAYDEGYKEGEGNIAPTSVRVERSPTAKRATMSDIAKGTLVQHAAPLGVGKVVAVEPTHPKCATGRAASSRGTR